MLLEGQRVWFGDYKKPFKVRCANERFAICTQPYNFKPETVIYTIVDFKRNVRGMDNYVFSKYDYYFDEECRKALEDLAYGCMEVSYKSYKYVELDIKKVL